MMKETVVYMNGGLVPGKNLDVLGFWKNHEKQFPLLAKVDTNTILLSIILLYNSWKRYIYRLLSIMLLYNSCKRYIYRFITENMNSGQFPARLYIIEYYRTLLAITVWINHIRYFSRFVSFCLLKSIYFDIIIVSYCFVLFFRWWKSTFAFKVQAAQPKERSALVDQLSQQKETS